MDHVPSDTSGVSRSFLIPDVNFLQRRSRHSVHVAQNLVKKFTDMHDEASGRVFYA
jgi:hypothetical protein